MEKIYVKKSFVSGRWSVDLWYVEICVGVVWFWNNWGGRFWYCVVKIGGVVFGFDFVWLDVVRW